MRGRTIPAVATFGLLAACVGASGCKGGGGSKEIAQVPVSYTMTPTKSIPRGMEAVAVIDAETTDDAEKKWSELAANMISGLVDESARKGGTKLKVADRKNLKKVLAEKDMALVGMVDGSKAAEASKLLGVQGLILSSIKVKVEKHVGKARTITGASFSRWYYGSPNVGTEEVEKVSRNITVQCKFSLIDAATSKVLIDYVSPTLRKMDQTKPSPFYGSSQTEAELTPQDAIVGELVEKEVRKFIGQFLPVEVQDIVVVQASKNEACQAGVRFLAAGEFGEAINMFKQAIAEGQEGDPYATFGMGVAYEAKGELDKALEQYRTGVRLSAAGAEEGMQRVKARMAAAGQK
ncbi:MAG: tetratricopeptide repeat protein [Phycisphaerae bacterium]|nr:tetratricopeptide repeat protein [Phycisphaerae bacterium]